MISKQIEFASAGVVAIATREIDLSDLKVNEVVIQNEASIISSGTELANLYAVGRKNPVFPYYPGYGAIGRIIAKGSGVTDFEIGERTYFAGKHASVQKFEHANEEQWSHLFKIDQRLDPVEGVVGCMAEIALTAPNITPLKLNDTVAIFGLGIVGVLASMLYKIYGAKVIGLDPVKERCALAKRVGIETVIDALPEAQVEELKKITGGRGADITVDCVGHSAVICNCVKGTAYMGQIVLLGTPRAPYESDMNPMLQDVHVRGLVMRGALLERYPLKKDRFGSEMSVEWALQTVFELIGTRRLDVRPLLSHVISYGEAPQTYRGLHEQLSHYTSAVIDWRL